MQIPAVALTVVLLGGAATVLQAPINAALGRAIGGSIPAAVVLFGASFVVLFLLALMTGQAGTLREATSASPIVFLGGALGAFYVWALLWAIPTFGVLSTFTTLILGQMTAAILLDAMGLFGLAVHSITSSWITAAGLVGAGVVLSRQ